MSIATITWENRPDGTVATSADGVNFTVPSLSPSSAHVFDNVRSKWGSAVQSTLNDLQSPVPARVVLAIIRSESGGDPSAKSSAGAIGLMQVMPSTAGMTVEQLLNAGTNLRAGIRFLDTFYLPENDLPAIASMYNAGFHPSTKRPWENHETAPAFQSEYGFRSNQGYIDHVVRSNNYAILGTTDSGHNFPPPSGQLKIASFGGPIAILALIGVGASQLGLFKDF